MVSKLLYLEFPWLINDNYPSVGAVMSQPYILVNLILIKKSRKKLALSKRIVSDSIFPLDSQPYQNIVNKICARDVNTLKTNIKTNKPQTNCSW